MKKILLPLLMTWFALSTSAQFIHVQENFNAAALPTGWSTTAVTGSTTWSFGIDGSSAPGINNLDGTSMAFFDDGVLGSSSSNNLASLTSPVFNNSKYLSTSLEFDYNFRDFLGPPDSFYVEVFDSLNWVTVFSRTTNDCGNWLGACIGNYPHAKIDISQFANTSCQVRFTYFDGNDWCWYVGIDNVIISSNFNQDIGVAQLISPISNCGLSSSEPITAGVVNYGGDTIRNFTITCNINNGSTLLTDTVIALIAAGDTLVYTLQNTADFSILSTYDIELFTNLGADTNQINDTLTTQVLNFFTNGSFLFQDFEGLNNWGVGGLNSSWQLGVPSGLVIDSAYSDSMAFVTNPTGAYNNNEESFLYSPCFDLGQMAGSPRLNFWLNYDTEINNDKLEMEYTLDGGITWSRLESEVNPQNWYPANTSWTGSSAGWIEVKNTLPSIVGNSTVRFRYRFLSNSSVTMEGAAIDDFRFDEVNDIDISLDSLLSPGVYNETSCGVRIEPVLIAFSNIGLSLVDSVFLSYQVDNGTLIHDTLVQRILPGDTITYTFNDSIRFLRIGNHQLTISLRVNGELKTNNNSLSNLIIPNTQFPSSATLPFYEPFNPRNFSTGSVNFNTDDAIGNGWTRSSVFTWRMAGNQRFRTYNNGPSKDNTGNNGLFAYVESNLGIVGDTALVESRCIDLNNVSTASLEFHYHRYSEDPLSDLFIDIFDGNQWFVVDTISGNTHASANDNWSIANINLDSFVGADIKVRFRTIKQSCCAQGTAIDDILIFERKSQDVGVFDVSINKDGCSFSDTLKVKIRNRGNQSIPGSIPVAYRINGGTTVNETAVLPIPLNSQTEYTYTFNNLINLNSEGSYVIQAWTNLVNDSVSINDSSQITLINHTKQVNQYVENFDSFLDGTCGNFPRLQNFGDMLFNGWEEKSKNEFGWVVHDVSNCGGTVSTLTGPNQDHTTGNGKFLYTEASFIARVAIDTAILESPCIDFSNKSTAAMNFWYHRYGANTGNLYIDVFANGVWNENVDSLVGQSQSSSNEKWKLKKVFFNQYTGQIIHVRFRAIYGGGFAGDMAIDDVEFYSPNRQDARLIEIDLTQASCEQDSAQLLLTVNNFGLDSILPNQIKVKYQINNGAIVTDSNAIGLSVDSNLTISLNVTNLYNLNNQRITAWVELPNDSNSFNDTLFYDIDLPSRAPEYIEGFENIVPSSGFCGNYNTPLNLAWQVNLNDQWVAGHDSICNYGANGSTPTSSTGPDSAYAGNGFMYFEPGYNSVIDTAVLTSTCIDLRNDSISYLDFYYHMYGAGTGKLYIEAKSTGGWVRLDSIVGQQHFASTDPWSLKTINLNQFSGNIMRIRFTAIESQGANSDQGAISIDNVRISNSFPVSLQETKTSNGFVLFPNPTKGEFILRGNGFSANELVISLLDLNGRLIESRIVNPGSNSINERFDLSNQANGVYLISIQSEGKVEVKKVVLSGR